MVPITVCLFASHPVGASCVARLLESAKDVCLVSGGCPFQVAVFDQEATSFPASLHLAHLSYPSMRPILLTRPLDEENCLRWIARGFWGVVRFDRWEADLLRAVRQVAQGRQCFPRRVLLRRMLIEARRFGPSRRLTSRQAEVMELVAQRYWNKESAATLNVAEGTIKSHLTRVYRKLEVRSRRELLALRAALSGKRGFQA